MFPVLRLWEKSLSLSSGQDLAWKFHSQDRCNETLWSVGWCGGHGTNGVFRARALLQSVYAAGPDGFLSCMSEDGASVRFLANQSAQASTHFTTERGRILNIPERILNAAQQILWGRSWKHLKCSWAAFGTWVPVQDISHANCSWVGD